MDPNATLAEIRRLAYARAVGEPCDLDRLAELTDALDGWLSNGGFLPDAWQR